jgi:uncharacterized protein (TIGR04551 family)
MMWWVIASSIAASTEPTTGFTDYGQDLVPREQVTFDATGYLRLRAEGLYDADLNAGTSASGLPLYPVPIGDPSSELLTAADMRLRTDLAAYAPGGMVAVKMRIDWLDNVELGSTPQLIPGPAGTPTPAGSLTQQPISVIHIKRAYAEALTPVGLIVAGRMGSNWGLGMLTNGGDCLDCDSGDSADRIAFITPLGGLLWAAAYDFSWSGPTMPRPSGIRVVELDPSAAVRTLTFAVLRYRDDWARERRRLAGKWTLDYGAYVSYRTQDQDVPAAYLPIAAPPVIDSVQVMYRGFQGTAIDLWARFTAPWLQVQAEGALLFASVAQASLVPGALLRNPITATQSGAALQSDLGGPTSRLGAGIDMGYASGDPAPDFGTQISLPYDSGVNAFRFSPDFRIDQILFREIIGTVTDAVYLRPHLRAVIATNPRGTLSATAALIASWALYASSTPGGKTPLGVEVDPSVSYDSTDGFHALLEYGLLFPLAGMDNPAQNLTAQPAQLLRLRLAYTF